MAVWKIYFLTKVTKVFFFPLLNDYDDDVRLIALIPMHAMIQKHKK